MKLKRIISLLLSLAMLVSVFGYTVSAINITTRRAGVIDNAELAGDAYSSQGVNVSDGMTAARTPAYVMYRISDDITSAFISVGKGAEGEDFKVMVSADGKEFSELKSLSKSKSFTMRQRGQELLSFEGIAKGQHYFKIEFLSRNAKIYGVYVNVDPQYTIYKNIYELAFKDNSSASNSTNMLEDFKSYKKTMITKLQSKADASSVLSSMSENGSWSNITYDGKSEHYAYEHCNRLTQILKAVSTPGNKLYKNADAISKACKAIDYWVNQGISFDNWYYNAVVVPQYVGDGLLVSQGILPPASEAKLANVMKQRVNYIDAIEGVETGSNIPNMMKAKINYALYMEDLQMLLDCFDRINMEVIMVDDMPEDQSWRADNWRDYIKHSTLPSAIEGIQADYSCLFHGPQIYSGGYGMSLLSLIAPMLVDTDGTQLFPQKGLQIIADHILEHYRYIVRGDTICYNTIGRQIGTNSNLVKSGNASSIFNTVNTLTKLTHMPRRDELIAFAETANTSTDKPYLTPDYAAAAVEASAEPEAASPASNAIDGNLTTRWASNNMGDEIITDLGKECEVGVVAISFYMGAARKTNFELLVSADKTNWTNICDGQSTGLTESYEYYVFPSKSIRYIRLVGYGNTSGEWNSINEISAFAKIPVDTIGNFGESYKLIDEIGSAKRYTLIEPEPVPAPAAVGHKFFWKTDYTAHSKDKFLFTIKTTSSRTLGSEQINYTNLKGEYQGNGSHFIYRTGKEYDDVFVAWDWYKVPGTTVEVYEAPNRDGQIDYTVLGSESERVGGVGDGNNGATAQELIRGNLSAKKAWFMFDNEVMALGTDIRLAKGKNELVSTVNQTLLKSDVIIGAADGSTKIIDSTSPEAQTASWVLQDRVGYVFEGNTKINVSAREQSGDRYELSWDGATSKPDKSNVISKNIFKLWFDHSKQKTTSYEYTIVPDVNVEDIKAYAANKPVEVIANKSSLQAVKNTKTGECQAVFWNAGEEVDFGDFKISADKEVIIAAEIKDGKFIISLASLGQREDVVKLSINKSLEGSGATLNGTKTEITIELPKGSYRGSSKTLEFAIK